jgi:hypothetical protein
MRTTRFLYSQNFDLIAERHEDTMICGTTPVVEQRPVPPALPILIFLFDDFKVAVRRGKIDTQIRNSAGWEREWLGCDEA